ncbi:MAG: two-component sensor protein [Syntrophorhabdaceae bacterium PtaU1.Bin034]|nr:MAG: two-component sensor protein [Syntrophorhabdaceae bacterium PtaU1.Bin034]
MEKPEKQKAGRKRQPGSDGGNGPAVEERDGLEPWLHSLYDVLSAAKRGDFSVRMKDEEGGILGDISHLLNQVIQLNERVAKEIVRVNTIVDEEGKLTERASIGDITGMWATKIDSINALMNNLARPMNEVGRVISAVAEGDLSKKVSLEIEGKPLKGEFLRIGERVNKMVDQLNGFAAEVTRVAREVGTEGKLGGQAEVKGVAGTWRELTENVNAMASNLTNQVRNIADVTTAVATGDLSKKITAEAKGEILQLKDTINKMVDQLNAFASEVTRVAREVGTEGKLGGQAEVKGVAGVWKDLTDNVNAMAANLTNQMRNIALVTMAVAKGDLSKKITVEARGEILQLKDAINTMVDQLSIFASELTEASVNIGMVSQKLLQAGDNMNSMVTKVSSSVEQIAEGAKTQAQQISAALKESEGVGSAASNTLTSAERMNQMADIANKAVREGSKAMVETISNTDLMLAGSRGRCRASSRSARAASRYRISST